jgi:hypothetical protein
MRLPTACCASATDTTPGPQKAQTATPQGPRRRRKHRPQTPRATEGAESTDRNPPGPQKAQKAQDRKPPGPQKAQKAQTANPQGHKRRRKLRATTPGPQKAQKAQTANPQGHRRRRKLGPNSKLTLDTPDLVTQLHHAVLVALQVQQMQRDILVEPIEERDAVADQHWEDRVANLISKPEAKALA